MTLWYLARAAGVVAMIMFTLSAALGIVMSGSRRPERRFWLQYVHRSAAATGLVLLATHVTAAIVDSFVAINSIVLVWPFGSGYRPFAMVVGVLALYGIVLTSVVCAARGRLARSASFSKRWRTTHVAASVGWLLSIGHALLAGTDRGTPWMLAITLGCLTAVAAAGAYRVRATHLPEPRTCLEGPVTMTMQDTRVIGQARVLAGLDQGRLDRQRHLWTHGAQPELTREDYTRLSEAVGPRGRGGAAFPVSLKLADLPAKASKLQSSTARRANRSAVRTACSSPSRHTSSSTVPPAWPTHSVRPTC